MLFLRQLLFSIIVVTFSIIVGVVCCFFFNYCCRSMLFLRQLLFSIIVVTFSIIVGVLCCFFFDYCWRSFLLRFQLLMVVSSNFIVFSARIFLQIFWRSLSLKRQSHILIGIMLLVISLLDGGTEAAILCIFFK